jgi:hypothetical protein
MNDPSAPAVSSVCVVHLVWAPLGLEPFRAFLDSYRRHPGGVAHRLLIAFNGFSSRPESEPYLKFLDGLEYSTLWLPNPVQDIAAYMKAAESSAEDWICFLNSHSVILCSDWLKKMVRHLDQRTRLVGASGSWESIYSSRRRWHRNNPRRGWAKASREARLLRWGEMFFLRRHFPPFPNPHLRTNAFLIERQLLFSLGFKEVLAKDKAHRFESGRAGLSARVKGAGLNLCVADASGRAWPQEDWPVSRTFRSGNQENLLISDNRTRAYEQASAAERRELAFLAWGTEEPVSENT